MRKIIQFAMHELSGIVALSDDGTLWVKRGTNNWLQIDPLPEPEWSPPFKHVNRCMCGVQCKPISTLPSHCGICGGSVA